MEACNKFKASVVKIISKLHRSIYGYKSGLYEATGFIIDVDKGWLAVNKHVVNQAFIQEIHVIFFDGSMVEARLVYNDPEHDFSIISVDNILIPLESYPMNFSKSIAKDNDIVSIMLYDRSEIIAGNILDSKISRGHFGTQSILINISTQFGDSGSPIVNDDCDVVGMQFAIDKNGYSISLHSSYIHDIIKEIYSYFNPIRQSIGAIFDYCKTVDLAKFLLIDEEIIKKDIKADKIVCVKSVIDMPSSPVLKVLDAIIAVDGVNVIDDLYTLHHYINHALSPLKLEVIRNGMYQVIYSLPFDLFSDQLNKALYINGAIIYNVDIFTHILTGAKIGKPFIYDVKQETTFYNIRLSEIKKLSTNEIESLDELLTMLPEIICKDFFVVQAISFVPKVYFNDETYFRDTIEPQYIGIQKDNLVLKLLEYDYDIMSWQSSFVLDNIDCGSD